MRLHTYLRADEERIGRIIESMPTGRWSDYEGKQKKKTEGSSCSEILVVGPRLQTDSHGE